MILLICDTFSGQAWNPALAQVHFLFKWIMTFTMRIFKNSFNTVWGHVDVPLGHAHTKSLSNFSLAQQSQVTTFSKSQAWVFLERRPGSAEIHTVFQQRLQHFLQKEANCNKPTEIFPLRPKLHKSLENFILSQYSVKHSCF